MASVRPPESSPEFAAIISLTLAVLGDDPKLLKRALANAADIAGRISSLDMELIRIRTHREDAKVRQDFLQAQVWLRGALEKYDHLGPF